MRSFPPTRRALDSVRFCGSFGFRGSATIKGDYRETITVSRDTIITELTILLDLTTNDMKKVFLFFLTVIDKKPDK